MHFIHFIFSRETIFGSCFSKEKEVEDDQRNSSPFAENQEEEGGSPEMPFNVNKDEEHDSLIGKSTAYGYEN